jgi:hypothetical protein
LIEEGQQLDEDYDLVVIGSFYDEKEMNKTLETAKVINLGILTNSELKKYES